MRVALRHAAVVTGTGETIDDGLVVLDGKRIVAVGRAGAPQIEADVVVDLPGYTVMPGMIDAHIHMIGGNKASNGGSEAGTFKMSDSPAKALLEGVAAAQVALRAGFTTVREVGGRDYLDVALRDAQKAGLVEAPRILASGPGVAVTGGLGEYLEPQASVSGPQSAMHRVRTLVARGVDVIKLVSADGPQQLGKYWSVFPSEEEIHAVFAEATARGRLKAAHAMGHDAIETVVAAGVDTVEHGWYLSEENCRTLIAAGTYLVPTASNIAAIATRGPGLGMQWAGMVAEEEPAIMDRFRMAIEMGVKIAAGTDIGGNESHPHIGENAKEIEVYVRCGMTPLAAIGSATLEAARAIRLDHWIGSLEPGKAADLIVIDGDPLTDISLTRTGVVAVLQDGYIRRDDLGIFDPVRDAASA